MTSTQQQKYLGLLRRFSFAFICLGMVLLGTILRVAAPTSAGSRYPPIVSGQAVPTPLPDDNGDGPEQVLLAFYRAMEGKEFARAADMAIELQWEWVAADQRRATGFKDRQQFVADSEAEMSASTAGFTLYEVSTEIDRMPPKGSEPLELVALNKLPNAPGVSETARVVVRGTAKILCIMCDFERRIIMVKTDGVWKILLPPPTRYSRARMQGWFDRDDTADKERETQ